MTDPTDTLQAVAGEEWERWSTITCMSRVLQRGKATDPPRNPLIDAADALIAKLVAALEEREGRRCGECEHWKQYQMWPDQGWCPQHDDTDGDCSCPEFAARERKESHD